MALVQGLTEPYLREIRRIVGDKGETFLAAQAGDGVTTRFDLPVERVDSATLAARYRTTGQPLTLTTDFVVQEDQGVVLLVVPVPTNETLVVSGTHYRYFTGSDYADFLDTAFIQHTHNQFDQSGRPLNYNSLPLVEVNLVAIRAAMEVYWNLAVDSSTDIDVYTPEGIHIPRHQRFAQILDIIQVLEGRYKELCSQLNVGLQRIENFDYRRVDRQTNRLIPVYRDQEIDDPAIAQRVLPRIDTKGDILITYKGAWVQGTFYAVNDEVSWSGQRYLCLIANATVQPDTDTSGTYWMISTVAGGRYFA